MVKCMLYAGELYSSAAKNTVERYEQSGEIEIAGITADKREAAKGYDVPFVDKSQLAQEKADAVIILSQDWKRERVLEQKLMETGVSYESIVPVSVMNLAGFDFVLYRKLRLHTPTIFSLNCMAGLIYHYMGLKFMSPIVKLRFTEPDYLRFLSDPGRYLSADLYFGGIESVAYLGETYPVAVCEDIRISLVHYPSFEEGVKKWNLRKQRIDWNNLVVLYHSDTVEMVRRFAALPYERKACFTGTRVEDPCVVPKQNVKMSELNGAFFRNAVNNFFFTNNADFNMFSFLAGEGDETLHKRTSL